MAFKVSIFSFTEKGRSLASVIAEKEYDSFRDEKIIINTHEDCVLSSENFNSSDAYIFIGALGIAVRKTAPFIRSKLSDPAVIVIDERARFVIPVLSGHIGGANDFAKIIADVIGAEVVITTATDINGYRAIDLIAADNSLKIYDSEGIKKINAKILRGDNITISSDEHVDVIVSSNVADAERADLHLYNKRIVLGVGCRKDVDSSIFEGVVLAALKQAKVSVDDVATIASIDIKENEKAILDFSKKYDIRFVTYTADELNSLSGDFDESQFVKEKTGVSNVSERAAVLAGDFGKFVIKRIAENGVTVSVFETKKQIFI